MLRRGGSLPAILQETRTQGGVPATVSYVYGLDLISVTDSVGGTAYLLTDGQGAVTDTYTYDVFGALRSSSGATANDFRYTGQQQDANANRGMYYLRARTYDPSLGRFLQKDRLPLLQRYAYAGNNPANYVDPRGLCWVCPFPLQPSPQGISDWTEQRMHELKSNVVDPFVAATGYVDLSATACLPGLGVCRNFRKLGTRAEDQSGLELCGSGERWLRFRASGSREHRHRQGGYPLLALRGDRCGSGRGLCIDVLLCLVNNLRRLS